MKADDTAEESKPDKAEAKAKAKATKTRERAPGLPKTGLKLYYWPATGKAQTIRLLLAEAGVEWEDVVFELEDPEKNGTVYSTKDSLMTHTTTESYKAFCAKCRELGGNKAHNIPMLEMNEKFYSQSHAIYRFVARKAGLYPTKIDDGFVVDNILARVEDARAPTYAVMMQNITKEKFLSEEVPKHLGDLERVLGDNDFYLPGVFSLADILVFDLLHSFYVAQVPDVLKDFPKLKGLFDRVGGREKIKSYLASDKCAKIEKMAPLP
mmetsp:Transcript_69957/g.202743  ORF Transcript_69957/g.202743 Transcript_69957/m.202743 type:complete len:266 (+) Transcript_69957:186-983(+)